MRIALKFSYGITLNGPDAEMLAGKMREILDEYKKANEVSSVAAHFIEVTIRGPVE